MASEPGVPYTVPWKVLIRAALYIARGRRRSLVQDASHALGAMPAEAVVRGEEHVPRAGTFVVVANHYERPHLWMAWPALCLGQVVGSRTGADIRWVAIREWESFSIHGIPIPIRVIRWVFERAFAVYGIIAMPPPEAPPGERATAVRQAVAAIRSGSTIGLMPEGTVGATPALLPARPGAGTFLLLAASAGATILPAGLYEEAGRLVVHIGQPFELELPSGIGKGERDAWARDRVMHAIKDLLPEGLWGVYRT